jgi:hypothetical protein
MSKIRQAVKYERQLVDAKVQAHIDLTNAQVAAAQAATDAQAALTKQAIEYERKYTDGQFGQLNLVAQEHRIFHEREHILYEQAIEKAAAALNSGLVVIQADVDRFRDEAAKWMTVDRFDREHTNLTEKTELAIKSLSDKINVEEKVTVRQGAQEELLARIQTNNRWLIGIALSTGLTLTGLVLHLFGAY